MTILNLPEEDHLKFEIAKLDLRPGDVLVARALAHLPSEAAGRIRAYIARELPGTKVLVIDAGLELSVVSKSEGKRLASAG